MRKLLFLLSVFYLPSTLLGYDLRVIVIGLKNNHGMVQVSLYNKEGTIPDKEVNRYYKTKRITIANSKKIITVFHNLPKGRYAVSVFHDENSNRKVDKGFFMPIEGVGLSNFKKISLFHLPSFKNASFDLDRNKTVMVKMIYL